MGNVTTAVPPARLHQYMMGGLFLLIIGLGAWLSFEARHHEDETIRRELLRQASNVASTLSLENVQQLSFTADDAGRPAFQRITTQLRTYAETAGIHSLYTMQLRDGQLFFGPESLLPDDPYAMPPGTIYQEPSPNSFKAFHKAEPVIFGPVSDEFGEFLSAVVPIEDPRSGNVLMVLGQDFLAADWRAQVHKAEWIPLLAILAPMSLLLLGYLTFKTCRNSSRCGPIGLRNIQMVTYFAVMLQLTVIAFFCIRDIEKKTLQELFNAEANAKAQYYTATFKDIHRDLHSLISLFEASESMTHEEFSALCQPILDNNPIQACLWLPAWSSTNASMLTAGIKAEGIQDFAIRRFATNNQPDQESTDPIYPAVYVEPDSQRSSILGYDFNSQPALRETLLESLRSGLVSACLIPVPPPNTDEPSGLFVFEPVSHHRQKGLIGFFINTDELIEHQESNPSGEIPALSATLFELHSGKAPHPLSCSVCDQCNDMLKADLSVKIPIFAFGKTYMMLYTPKPQWFAANPQHLAWIALAIGLMLTLLLTYLAAVLLNQPLLLQQLVQQRTLELAESKERFDIAISAARLGVWERDVTSSKLIWNDRMLKIYGIQKNEFDGDFHKWREFIHPEDHERVARELAEAETGEKRFDTEFRITCKDGEIRHIRAFGKMIRDSSGEPSRMIGINQDITEHRQTELALERSQKLLQNLVNAIPDLVWLKDTKGVYLACNQRFEQLYGAKQDEIIGKTDGDFVSKDLADSFREHDIEAMENGGPSVNEEWLTFVSDGHIELTETIKTPMYNQHGELRGVIGIGRNITERKEAEEDLRESEELFRSTVSDLQVGVVVHAEDTSIVLCNPAACRMLGLDAEQIAGKRATDPAWKFIREDGSVMPIEEFPVNRVMSTGKSISNQIIGIMKPDQVEPRWAIANAVRVFSGGSYLYRIIVNFMEVTEQINAERILKTRNAELERFNKVTVGRELRMIELKEEINTLCRKLGCEHPYAIPQASPGKDGSA